MTSDIIWSTSFGSVQILDFPDRSNIIEFACNAGDPFSILGSRRSTGEGNILAWRILWKEEPSGPQSTGLQ